MTTRLQRAIRIIEDSRDSHVRAIRWIERREPLDGPARRTVYGTKAGDWTTGGKVFHRQCIKDYEFVLRTLRWLAAFVPRRPRSAGSRARSRASGTSSARKGGSRRGRR